MALDRELATRPPCEVGIVLFAEEACPMPWSVTMSFAGTSPSRKPAADSQHPVHPPRIHCFSIVATADPSVLPRILDMVAMFDHIPERCHSSRLDHEPGRPLMIDLQIAGLSPENAHLIEKKLERMVLVTQILCSEKRQAAA